MKKMIAFGLIAVLVACGSKGEDKAPSPPETTTDNTTDPGVDGGPTDPPTPGSEAGPDTTPPHAPTNQAECIAACEVKHPTPAAQNKTFDNTCMLAGVCEPSCNGLVPGKNYQPSVDPDAGVAACDTVKANSDPISLPSQACADCVANTPACCNLWIAIFGSTEGKALSSCSVGCYSQFKN